MNPTLLPNSGHSPAPHSSASTEERRENGLGLIAIGVLLWFFDALMFFFMPAATRMGHSRPFVMLVGAAFVAGVTLIAVGKRLRKP
jgi:hypothetical protein